MANLSKTSMKAREILHEEVDEPSRIDLEEAVMIAADELGFEDLEYIIDLPTDTTEWLRETMDGMNDEDLIDLHKQIKDYKQEKEKKMKAQRKKAAKQIADLAKRWIEVYKHDMKAHQSINEAISIQAEKLANKLIK